MFIAELLTKVTYSLSSPPVLAPVQHLTRLAETPSKDFGLGIGVSELVVARSGRDKSTGGYQYTVVFLEETDAVPQMLVRFLTTTMPPSSLDVGVHRCIVPSHENKSRCATAACIGLKISV